MPRADVLFVCNYSETARDLELNIEGQEDRGGEDRDGPRERRQERPRTEGIIDLHRILPDDPNDDDQESVSGDGDKAEQENVPDDEECDPDDGESDSEDFNRRTAVDDDTSEDN